MAIIFSDIEDLRDPNKMRAAIKLLRRQSKPAAFAFKARCEALEGEPMLILAPPGKRVNPGLVRQVRAGSRTLQGTVHREGQELVFTLGEQVNATRMAAQIARIGAACGGRIPRQRIRIVTPADLPEEVEEVEEVEESFAAALPEAPPALPTFLEDADLPTLIQQAEETEYALETLRMDDMQWQVLAESSAETARQAWAAVTAAELALAEAPEGSEEREDRVWEVEALREDAATRDADAARLAGVVRSVRATLVSTEHQAARAQLVQVQSERMTARETLISARQAFLEAIAALEGAGPEIAARAALLADAEGMFGAMRWVGKADRDRLRQAQSRFAEQSAEHHSQGDQDRIRDELQELEQDIERLAHAVESGSSQVATLEAKIRSSRAWLIDAVRDHVRERPELSSPLHLMERSSEACALAEAALEELDARHQEAEERAEEAARRRALHRQISSATTGLAAARALRDPDDTTLDHEPLLDLRQDNRHLHAELMHTLHASPELAGLLTELVLRIQRLEDAGARELKIYGEVHGPLTDLWETMPSSTEPAVFAQQLRAWQALEGRMWKLLGTPMEVHR